MGLAGPAPLVRGAITFPEVMVNNETLVQHAAGETVIHKVWLVALVTENSPGRTNESAFLFEE